MLTKVKLALRITTTTFDSELNDLIAAGKADLGLVGIEVEESEPLISKAIITYCKLNFGEPDEYDRLKAAYDEQKAQLKSCTLYNGSEF